LILLLDAGNSRFKWAELRDEKLSALHSKPYDGEGCVQGVMQAWQNLKPKRILAVSVLGDKFKWMLSHWARSNVGVDIEFVETQRVSHGVQIAYSDPQSLGVDRFVALVGAHHCVHTANVIIDCGTAVTLDAITSQGQHLGGLIFPGLQTMRRSLITQTAAIRNSVQPTDLPLFAKDTDAGVSSGTLRAVAAAIDQISASMAEGLDGPVTRILCGGDARQLMRWLTHEYHHDPMLVLKGLAQFASG
jgi:type III pantothenate kinase